MSQVRIGITLGDPSGIGAEIVVSSLREMRASSTPHRTPHMPDHMTPHITVWGDATAWRRALVQCGVAWDLGVSFVAVSDLPENDVRPGRPTPAGGASQVAALEAAVVAARAGQGAGQIDALVTAPISKTSARAAGFAFPGHTEFLAERLGDGAPLEHAMMFAGPRLRVVLATIHLPLGDVPRILSPEHVARAVYLGGLAMACDFGVSEPRIGVLGLNPHAGEGGLFGQEELLAIVPGMAKGHGRLRAAGVTAKLSGPLVPDAAFRKGLEKDVDLLVAMYHDQGLIPVKLVDFEESVNVTLGLPIVRTSPDHGVAYDIAGEGVARHQSFLAALILAKTLAQGRRKRDPKSGIVGRP